LFLDSELRIKLFTPATTRLLKLIPSDTGRPISDLSMNFIDYDLPADVRAVAQKASVIEREVQHTEGSFYLVRVMPYRTQNDQADGVIVTFTDVTGLRRAEKQIRRLATAVTDSNDAVILFDVMGNVQAWNRGAQNMYGWSETEAVGMNFSDLVPADKAAESLDLMPRLRAGGAIASFETRRLTKDGRILDVWLTATSLLDEAAKVEAFATTERDITERKRAEEALRNINVMLEQRIQERTSELNQRAMQLRALAMELAQTEERERKRLAQVLHDQLQQLLVAAKFRAASLQKRVGKEVQIEVHDVLDLLGQSIDASRSLTVELSPPILHDGGLAAGLMWLSRWMQQKHGIVVEVTAQEPPTSLSEDLRYMCFQAVRELLLNVVKHAGVKSAQVVMTHELGRSLRIVVSDNGKGYDPGAQAVGVASGSFGLFSIRERFALLGGRLEVDSAPDQGTRAILTVPILYSASSQPKESRSQFVEKPIPPVSASGMIRILVVDDHTLFRKGLVELLQKTPGFAVVGEAVNGQQALDQARQLKPDVVLMDVTMPQMDGIDATRLLLSEVPEVRIIGLSMHAHEMAALMKEAGAVRYFAKDGHIEDLAEAIREVCPRQDNEQPGE
jgi:PAS domain S-box-containing protein